MNSEQISHDGAMERVRPAETDNTRSTKKAVDNGG